MFSVWELLLLLATLCLYSSLTTAEYEISLMEIAATKDEGSCVTINCTYEAQKDMQLLWFQNPQWNGEGFDGTIVYSNTEDRPQSPEFSDRVEYQGSYTGSRSKCMLRINNLQINDSGNYTFRYIKGSLKYMSKPLYLTINANPCKVRLQAPRELKNNTLKENDTVIFQCSTSANCSHHPEWHGYSSGKIRKIEDPEKISELHLNVTWMDDGRTLSCGPAGSTDDCQTRNINLTVQYAPRETKIIVSSEDVKEEQRVTLHCSSRAHPNASITWFKKDQKLVPKIKNQYTEEYELNDIKPEDSGEYHCRATNDHGTEDSPAVTINVKYAPKGVQVKAEPSDVTKGDELRLTCLVQKSNPEEHSYTWYKNNVRLHQNHKELYIPSITQSHDGRYHCQVSNTVGFTDSVATEISVKYAPEDTSIQGISEVKLGSTLTLSCSANANPYPDHYSWYYKAEDMQQYVVHSHANQQYWIEKVLIQSSGWYMCSSQNAIGTGLNSTAFRVHVLYPPRQPHLTMADVLKETEMLNVKCTVRSYPMAKITLSRISLTSPEEVEVMSILSNTLMFAGNVSESHAGVYTCTARNSEGENCTRHQLKVLYAPKRVHALVHGSEEPTEGSDLTLTCQAHSEPSVSMYAWNKSSGTGTKGMGLGQNLNLRSLNASDTGKYFCTAHNELGSNSSAPVQIRVQYRPYIKIIHNLTSLARWDGDTPVQLVCSADSYPSVKYYEWYKKDAGDAVLVDNVQNYTVQPQKAGTYYCGANNGIKYSKSEPVELLNNGFYNRILLQILIPIFILCILIGVIILVHRFFMRKRSVGAVSQSPFFTVIHARSSTVSDLFLLGSRNNTRENLVIEETMEPCRFSGNQSATTTHSNTSTNRDNPAGSSRPVSNLHTVYDAIKFPQTMQDRHPHKQVDSTSVNYANLNIKDHSEPTKQICSSDGGGPVYSVVSKYKQKTKVVEGGHEDYENISGACAPKPDLTNINWDSSSSEEEEELNYSKVTVTGTPQRKPQRTGDDSSSEEEARTEYSQVKI